MAPRCCTTASSSIRRRDRPTGVAVSARPLVSVVVPTFDRAALLAEAVASVLAQSYWPLELVVVDDGSTDDTERQFSTRGDLRYLRIAHTAMPGRVRNAGVEAAAGNLIAFLDSDDLWLPHKLQRQVAAMATDKVALHHTRERWLRHGRTVSQHRQQHTRKGDLFPASLRKCVIGPSTVLLHRSALNAVGGFREDIQIAEDYELWLRLTARYRVGYLDEALTIKRAGHGDQLSERHGHIELFRLRALHALLTGKWPEDGAQRRAAHMELARKACIYAGGCAKRGRIVEAEEYRALARQANARSTAGH